MEYMTNPTDLSDHMTMIVTNLQMFKLSVGGILNVMYIEPTVPEINVHRHIFGLETIRLTVRNQ